MRAKAGPIIAGVLLLTAIAFPGAASANETARLLKKESTNAEMIQIAQVVVLPRDNEFIVWLSRDGGMSPGRVRHLHPMDRPNVAVVLWPAKDSPQPTATV